MSKDVKFAQVPLLRLKIFAVCNHVAAFDAVVFPSRDINRGALTDHGNFAVLFIDLYGFDPAFYPSGKDIGELVCLQGDLLVVQVRLKTGGNIAVIKWLPNRQTEGTSAGKNVDQPALHAKSVQ